MKVRIELDDRLADTELVIQYRGLMTGFRRFKDALNEATAPAILFTRK